MKKLFALVVAAAMGLSSVAFAADNTAAKAAPAAATTIPAKSAHNVVHRKHKKAQTAKKHHKQAAKPVAQKAQSAKKHDKKAVKPAAK